MRNTSLAALKLELGPQRADVGWHRQGQLLTPTQGSGHTAWCHIQLGVTASRSEWPAQFHFLRLCLWLLGLPKATRRQPDALPACWQGFLLGAPRGAPTSLGKLLHRAELYQENSHPQTCLPSPCRQFLSWALLEPRWVFPSLEHQQGLTQSLLLLIFTFSLSPTSGNA